MAFPPPPERVTQADIESWAGARADQARRGGTTKLYLPRFRDRAATEVVRHASFHVGVPREVGQLLQRRIMGELQRNGVDIGAYKILKPTDMHATYGWMNPGKNAQEDEARIADATHFAPELMAVAARVPQSVFTVTGVVLLDKQLLVTYSADTWNAAFQGMEALRGAVPRFADGGYDLNTKPLDGGQIFHSTVAMTIGEIDIAGVVDALEKWLPGREFKPVSFVADELMLVVHRFDPENVLSKESEIAVSPLASVPNLAKGNIASLEQGFFG